MKKTHDIQKIFVAATPTLYTLYSLDDYILEIKNLGFTNICFMRADRPRYASIEAEENLDYYVQKYEKFLSTYDGMKVHFFENIYNRKYDINIDKSNVRDWIEFMNKKRGFDIRKYVPELNKF
jgi:2-iminoacetate synthase ThiH